MNFEFQSDYFGFEYFIGFLFSVEAAIENYSGKRVFLKLRKILEKYIWSSLIFSKVVV